MTNSGDPEGRRFVAHYEVEATLGRGSVGTVYRARDRRIGRKVALKMIEAGAVRFEGEEDEREFFERLQREVEICGQLTHVNLVTLFDVGYEHGRVSYLSMELVDGPSLLDLIKKLRPEPLPAGQVLDIAIHALRGLAYAHQAGIVHRDIKPANILLASNGVAKIADFGIARPADSSMTATGTLMGTPHYMSPEQVRGEVPTPGSDLFSFGSVLYEMLTGKKPFAATDISGILYKVVGQPHPPIESPPVPVQLVRLVDRLLEKRLEDRPASAEEVLAELEAIEAGADTLNETTSVTTAERDDATVKGEIGSDAGEVTHLSGLATLRRVIPASIFWSVVGICVGALIAVAFAIGDRIDPTPTVTIPEETLAEFAAKKESLAAAEQLCSEGRFDDCIAAYDAYLESYPYARAAVDARDEAQRLRDEVRAGNRDTQESRSAWKKFTRGVKRLFGKD